MAADMDVKGAKEQRMPWADLAKAVRRNLERKGGEPSMRSPLIADLARLSGYSPAMLLRQVRLLEWVEAKSAERRVDPARHLAAKFAGLELVMLIDRHAPDRSDRLMDAVAAGELKNESLRRELKSFVRRKLRKDSDGRDALSFERHERRRRVRQALETGGYGPLLTARPKWKSADGKVATHGPVCRFTWWRPTANGPEGYDLMHLPAGTTARAVDDRIARSLASAPFFSLYLIVLVQPTPFLELISEALDWARLPHVGILTADMRSDPEGRYHIKGARSAMPGAISDRVVDFLRAVSGR